MSAEGCEKSATVLQDVDGSHPCIASSTASALQVQPQQWDKWPSASARKDGTRLANYMRGKQDRQPDRFGACDWRKKKPHLNKQRSKTCQKYLGTVGTTALPRFLEAGKWSRSVGGLPLNPTPRCCSCRNHTAKEGQRQDGGGDTCPSVTLVGHTHWCPDLSAFGSFILSVPLIISIVTGRYTTTPLMLYSLCTF